MNHPYEAHIWNSLNVVSCELDQALTHVSVSNQDSLAGNKMERNRISMSQITTLARTGFQAITAQFKPRPVFQPAFSRVTNLQKCRHSSI